MSLPWLTPTELQDFCEGLTQPAAQARHLAELGIRSARPGALATFFAPPFLPTDLQPKHVQEFLDLGAQMNRPTPANREKAALSAAVSWMIREGHIPGLTLNPCMRASGVRRNKEEPDDYYIPHEDYAQVLAAAGTSVALCMELARVTLQRPESDLIKWTASNIKLLAGKRCIVFRQNKTQREHTIELPSELDALIRQAIGSVPRLHQHLIHTLKGEAYTYDGLSGNLRKAIARVNKARKRQGLAKIKSFGFKQITGMGATDMWLAKIPLEQIQQLKGHASVTTTEIYVKQRWRVVAQPNRTSVAA